MTEQLVRPRQAPRQPDPAGRRAVTVADAARALVDPALRDAVRAMPEVLRHAAGYHFGWWDEHGRSARQSGGKALRPVLALLAAEAVGGRAAQAVPAAVAVELVHNFSLIHDDVMDGDATRRHRPTVWKVFGVGQAILVGDALLGRAFAVLADETVEPLAARTLAAAVGDLLHGEGDDVAFETRDDVSLAECVAMAGRKTGALLACACALGALTGGGSPEQIARLRAFGADVGLAFQLVDDILGIWGDPRVTGKPVHSDLRSRKRSLPVVAALASGSPLVTLLSEVYAQRGDLDDTTVAQLADAVERAGGRQWCVEQARMLIGRAIEGLAADPTLTRVEELSGLARLLIERDR